MTTAQDQRFDVEAQHAAEAIAIYKAVTGKGDAAYSTESPSEWGKWERAAIAAGECRKRIAARTLPAPENVRAGEPYDNPAFEDLARTMGVWGTAQAALCAQFFLAGHGAQVAPLTDERIRQLDDATNFHESHTWSIRFARAIEAELRKKVTP